LVQREQAGRLDAVLALHLPHDKLRVHVNMRLRKTKEF
jgi:hypothetical protein